MAWSEPEHIEYKTRYKDLGVLWSSNALWVPTGYGVEAKHMLPRMMQLGIKCTQFAWYGLEGASLSIPILPGHPNGTLDIYPRAADPFGFDVMGAYAQVAKADIVLNLHDIWIIPHDYKERIDGLPWVAWFPVDMTPCPPEIATVAKLADYPMVYSQWGTKLAHQAGVEAARYMPMGVDCTAFHPMDRNEARAKFPELGTDNFVIGIVGTNKGLDCRKGFPEALLAFTQFIESIPRRGSTFTRAPMPIAEASTLTRSWQPSPTFRVMRC